ncbi:MAG: hypothetical protein JW709_10570 [Sedimentisphaerales bacterium]|nr:hypothetical protein [Sedimentisphaerales bacterium]
MDSFSRITYFISRKAWQYSRRCYYRKLVRQAGALEADLTSLDDESLAGRISDLRSRAGMTGKLGPLKVQALALGREVSRRHLGMRHYDVQLIGTLALYDGCIAEMDTGEGKTLMAPLAAWMYLLEQPDHSVHIITANEYLAQRDAQWMAPLYVSLGLTVGMVLPGQSPGQRREAYRQKVVYSAAREVVFDSLREPARQKQMHIVDAILRPGMDSALDVRYDFAIVDEVDSVLIDQARSPMALGGAGDNSPQTVLYQQADVIAGRLLRGEHYRLMHDDRKVELKEEGKAQARREAQAAGILRLLPPGHLWQRYVTCALAARYLYRLDEHYVVREGKVVLLDESTGRMIPGRQLPDGIHQAIEVRNGLMPSVELRGTFQTTFQTYFRKYSCLAGMTGTASMAAREFLGVYGLPIMPIPSNKPSQRHIHRDRVYRSLKAKYRALIEEIEKLHATGRPLLIGTGSVKISEDIGRMLDERRLPHEILNAKNHAREAEIIAQAGQTGRITIITNMAGRGVDIVLGEGIAQKGGMALIGTDRLPFRRLDDQLTGRVGRQGDPADCVFFLSLRDDMLRTADRKVITRIRRKSRRRRYAPLEDQAAERLFARIQRRNNRIVSKQRRLMYMGEKQRERLKEKGLWEDWMGRT